MQSPQRLVAMVVATLILAVVFFATYTRVLGNFKAETEKKKGAHLFSLGKDLDDGVEVTATVVGVDPGKGDLVVRLEFEPVGEYVNEDDGSLKSPVTIGVNAASGKAEYPFKAKELMGPVEFTTNLKGSAADYPFDHQSGEIYVTVSTPEWESKKPAKDAPPDSYSPVPIKVTGNAHVGGFKIDKIANAPAEEEDDNGKHKPIAQPETGEGFFFVTVETQRSGTVVQFALMVMTLQWLLALSAYVVALNVVVGGRKCELPFFAWLAALLFALPPLRNIMVGAPPIGIYSDYLAFLWCEGIVALCLVSIVFTWVVRKP